MDRTLEKRQTKKASPGGYLQGLWEKLITQHVQGSESALQPRAPERADIGLPLIAARVAAIIEETRDTKSYLFTTELPLGNYKAGSHIHVEIASDEGVIRRTYTLSSSPKDADTHSITVKRVKDGLASNWLFDHFRVGDAFKVSQPQGDFVLPYQPSGKLLLLSAGSGVTPVMSMLRYLALTGNRSDIAFLHYAQSPEDIIFHKEIMQLAGTHPGVKPYFSVERMPSENVAPEIEQGRINQAQLTRLVPDVMEREIYLCGPQPFMKATMEILSSLDFNPTQLHFENFTRDRSASTALGYQADLTFSSIVKTVSSSSSKTILEEAEAAGLKPQSACRMGICRTCRCKKQSGITVNLVTGEQSTRDGDYILPCVSVAKTATTVEL